MNNIIKTSQLKVLIKNIILEMIANKDKKPDFFGWSNIGENDGMKEQSASGAAGAYSPPMGVRKIKEEGNNFINKVKQKIGGMPKMANEKTNPDGTYSDDMLDGNRDSRISKLNENDNILFTPQLFRKLKLEYNKAIKENRDRFVFEGREILTSYAKYLIEYLTSKFSKMNEMSSTGGSSGSGMGYQAPAWVSKNKEGSSRAIAASKSLGYNPVKSISCKEKKI